MKDQEIADLIVCCCPAGMIGTDIKIERPCSFQAGIGRAGSRSMAAWNELEARTLIVTSAQPNPSGQDIRADMKHNEILVRLGCIIAFIVSGISYSAYLGRVAKNLIG